MAGAARVFTDEQIAKALKSCKGLIFLAAKKIGCVPRTIQYRLANSEALRDIAAEARGQIVDIAESGLYRALTEKDSDLRWKAIQFTLKHLGQDRGYIERQDHRIGGSDGGAIKYEGTIDVNLARTELFGICDSIRQRIGGEADKAATNGHHHTNGHGPVLPP